MASVVGIYYKTGGIETGGTNALTGLMTGGTLVSSGDTEATPVPFGVAGTVYTLYYVAEDSGVVDANAEDSSAAFAPVLPLGWTGCFTYNGTFSATPTTGATIVTGGYQPFYVKQPSALAAATQWVTGHTYSAGDRVYQSGSATTVYVCPTGQGHTSGTFATDLAAGKWAGENLSTGAVTWTTGTRVGQVGTVTPTPGDGQMSCAWSAVSGAARYRGRHKLHADSTWIDDGVVTSPWVKTGLTNGSSYDFAVRAEAATGAGLYSATATATPLSSPKIATYSTSDEKVASSWSAARSAASADTTGAAGVKALGLSATYYAGSYYIDRGFLQFDGVFTGYTQLRLHAVDGSGNSDTKAHECTGDSTVVICQGSQTHAGDGTIPKSDYSSFLTTEFGRGDYDDAGALVITFNAAGLAYLAAQSGGTAKFCLRPAKDFDNVTPTVPNNGDFGSVDCSSAAMRPALVKP